MFQFFLWVSGRVLFSHPRVKHEDLIFMRSLDHRYRLSKDNNVGENVILVPAFLCVIHVPFFHAVLVFGKAYCKARS